MFRILELTLALVCVQRDPILLEQPVWILEQPRPAESRLRGVAVSSTGVVWATGADGAVLTRKPGRNQFVRLTIPDSDRRDFRDVEVLGEETIFLLAIGEGEKSRILKSKDGGISWSTRFIMTDPKGFLDAIAFWDERHGIALGDPVAGRFTILLTDDGGETWTPIPESNSPEARSGEGAFAASGTCLSVSGSDRAWFCTGGAGPARVFLSTDRGRTWSAHDTPIPALNSSSGLFSVAFRDELHGIAVGGDYRETEKAGAVVSVTTDGGITWNLPTGRAPVGLRSAVVFVSASVAGTEKAWVAVGPAGSDLSLDDGQTWQPVPSEGFHAVGTRGRESIWSVGEVGRVGRLKLGQ